MVKSIPGSPEAVPGTSPQAPVTRAMPPLQMRRVLSGLHLGAENFAVQVNEERWIEAISPPRYAARRVHEVVTQGMSGAIILITEQFLMLGYSIQRGRLCIGVMTSVQLA